MRRRLIQGVDVFFTRYVWIIVSLWIVWILVDIILGLAVFPSERSGIWYVGLGGSIGFIIGMFLVAILKALFHKRIIQALDDRKGSHA